MLRGTIDKTKPQDAALHVHARNTFVRSAGKHRCREKIKMIAGVLYKLELPAAAHLLVNVWNGNFAKIHAKMRSPSAYTATSSPRT
eukprot:612253-Pleurochrysis_carterae.AAC.2